MNDTPTPETDSRLFDPIEYMDQGGSCLGSMISRKDGDWVCSDFARKLERERDEARRLAEKYRNLSCDTLEKADETLLPWETTTQNEP